MTRPYPWKCRNCRQKMLHPVNVDYTAELEHDGRLYKFTVKNLEILLCDNCGEQKLPDDSHNKVLSELRRQAGLLMPWEITERRERLELSQKEFAHILGVAPATVSRWETGAQIQQRVMNDFMLAFFDVPELRDYLGRLRGGGVTHAKPAVSNTTFLAQAFAEPTQRGDD